MTRESEASLNQSTGDRGPANLSELYAPVPPMRASLFWSIIAALLLLAIGLRLFGLERRDIWLDESCTSYAVQHFFSWPEGGPDRTLELAHYPYFLLLKCWTLVAGDDAGGLRSFSVLWGCLAIPVMAWIGRRMRDHRVGIIVAALAAVHPLHIYYSQEARVYSLWMLEGAIGLYLLYRAGKRPDWRRWVGYGLWVWVMVLTHYYTLLWLPATITVCFVAADRKLVARRWIVTHAVLLLTLLPLILMVVLPHTSIGPKPWLNEIWREYPPILAVPKSIWALLPAGSYPEYLGTLHLATDFLSLFAPEAYLLPFVAPVLISAMVLAAAVASLTALLVRRRAALASRRTTQARPDSDDRVSPTANDHKQTAETTTSANAIPVRSPRRTLPTSPLLHQMNHMLFLLGGSVLFLIVAAAFSALGEPSYAVARYDLLAWPGFLLGIAVLIRLMPTSWQRQNAWRAFVQFSITLALCTCSLLTILASHAVPITHVQRSRASRIAEIVGPNDLLVSFNLYKWHMAYEWHQQGFSPEVISFPSSHDRQMCWDNAPVEQRDPEQIQRDVERVINQILEALDKNRRVFLLSHGETTGSRFEVDWKLYDQLRGLSSPSNDVWADAGSRFHGRLRDSRAILIESRDQDAGLAELVPIGRAR